MTTKRCTNIIGVRAIDTFLQLNKNISLCKGKKIAGLQYTNPQFEECDICETLIKIGSESTPSKNEIQVGNGARLAK